MTTSTYAIGTRTAISGASTAANSLASATYVVLGTVTFASSGKVPLKCKLEATFTPGTVSGSSPQVSLWAQESLDGTNFGTGPTSGTTTTNEPNLRFLGTVPLGTSSTAQTGILELSSKFGGMLPYAAKIIAKNESGAALASSGHSAFILTGSGDTA